MDDLALLDWDGTLFPGFSLLPWSEFLSEQALFKQSALRDIANAFAAYRNGKLEYDALFRQTANLYASGIAGDSRNDLVTAAASFSRIRHPCPFTPLLLNRLSGKGLKSVVISGAPMSLLRAYAQQLDIDRVYALEIDDDAQGTLRHGSIDIGLATGKRRIVNELSSTSRIAIAFGNGPSDLPLFEAAKIGILFNCHKNLFPREIQHKLVVATEDNVIELTDQILRTF